MTLEALTNALWISRWIVIVGLLTSGTHLVGLERQLRFYSIFFTLRAFGFMVDLFIR